MNIIQIVPRLPPVIDGVGDYALNLARQLPKDFNIQTHFIVGSSTWKGQLAARLAKLSVRLRGNQVLKNFQKLTKNGLKNTKNCNIDYNSNCPPTFL